jgi:hypothetical protein
MYFSLFGKKRFFCSIRTIGGSGDPPSGSQNRHVSLANIASAFLSERKSSSHRQSSARRQKRLTVKRRKSSYPKRQSNYPTAADEILGQRLSTEIMDEGIATIFASNSDNKHRSTTVNLVLYKVKCLIVIEQ